SQPFTYDNCKKCTIVYNGEIYNYVELKDELIKKGYTFRTSSDTEVLAALYLDKGNELLNYIDGMFAFAIWDYQENKIFCARDRFGEKPFYYSINKNYFVFASEIKSIFASGIKKEINLNRLCHYLAFNQIENSNSISETFYNDVYSLEPAHYLEIKLDGNITKKNYWDITCNVRQSINIESASEELKNLLCNSIKLRLRSDVNIGSSLSGGLDSSIIVKVIDDLVKGATSQKTFSARYQNFERDEGFFIDRVSSEISSRSYSIWPTAIDFVREFDNIFYHQEEPFESTSIFAQWQVMKLAKEQNTVVILDGQGADELFAGYHGYFYPYILGLYKTDSKSAMTELAEYNKLHKKNISIGKLLQLKIKFPILIDRLDKLKNKQNSIRKLNISGLSSEFVNAYLKSDNLHDPVFHDLNSALLYSIQKKGLTRLLRYSDRNSMAHSREVRLPFLDHKIAEFCFSLPERLKIKMGWTKYVLRKTYEKSLPDEIIWRKDKTGFVTPENKWFKDPLFIEMFRDSSDKLKRMNFIKEIVPGMEWRYLMANSVIEFIK
ncbi:MAG: asparagine synthase (glutamine-hydrolyzing), partial [Bacteroidota bacterium]